MKPVLGIRIGTRMFLGLPDPDPSLSQGVERTEIKIVFFCILKIFKIGVGSGSGSESATKCLDETILFMESDPAFSCRTLGRVRVWFCTVTKSVPKAQYMILRTVDSHVPDPNPDLDPPDPHVFGPPGSGCISMK
jgi:hypothetical protein